MSISVPILMYHTLDEQRSPIALSPAVFAWQMRWLAQNGYQVLALAHLIHLLKAKQPLPPRSLVLTFDDGFASLYTHAFPILTRYGFPATVFLVSEFCGRQNNWPDQPLRSSPLPLLNWAQIREMDRHGITFGAHTATHPWLDRCTPAELNTEICTAQLHLQDQLGHPLDLFAYPYGRYTQAAKTLVERTYQGACATHLGMVNANSDPFALPRIEAQYMLHPWLFQWLAHRSFAFYLQFRLWGRHLAGAILQRPWA